MAPCNGELGNTDPDVVLFTQMAGERLEEDPADADALFVLAASRMMCGRAFEAAVFLGRLAQIRADYPGLWHLKRRAHEALGDHRAADACTRAGIRNEDA